MPRQGSRTPSSSSAEDDEGQDEDGTQALTSAAASASSPFGPGTHYTACTLNEIHGSPDPFNCLPGDATTNTWRLFDEYLDARCIQPAVADLQVQVRNLRRNVWFPMIMESRATYTSFVLFLELDRAALSSGSNVTHRMNTALGDMSKALIRPDKAPIDSLCYGVLLLLITAQYVNDIQAMETHLNGLAALITHRGGLFVGNDYLARAVLAWGFGPLTGNKHPASAVIGWAFHKTELSEGLCLFKMPLFMHPSTNPGSNRMGPYNTDDTGFNKLRNELLISDSMLVVVPRMRMLNQFLIKAKKDPLAYEENLELLRNIWFAGWSLYNTRCTGQTNHLDDCCRWTMLLCCYYDIFPTCLSSESQIAALIHQQLMDVDMEVIMPFGADALLWIGLVAGPITTAETALWFSRLVMTAGRTLNIASYSDAVRRAEGFFWSRSMDARASVFWRKSLAMRQRKSFRHANS